MARDYDSFVGLTRELRPVGPTYKSYFAEHAFGGGINTFSGDLETTNELATSLVEPPTHYSCFFDAVFPSHPEPGTIDCPQQGGHSLSVIDDLAAARTAAISGFPTESVTERALLVPTPSFVQVHIVDCIFDITPGTEGCGLSWVCGPDAECTITYDMSADFAFFNFDDPYDATTTLQTRQTRTWDNNVANTLLTGWLWRDPDADSYTGDPTNEASDTLIPWADFIASPFVTLQASITGHFVTWESGRFIVDLWYPTGAVSSAAGLTCFIGGV